MPAPHHSLSPSACRPGLQPRGGPNLGISAPTRFQCIGAAARHKGGGRREHCSHRGGREQCQCGHATPDLDHLELLLREEQGPMGMKPSPAAPNDLANLGWTQSPGLLSHG